jgi:hypothetical protein
MKQLLATTILSTALLGTALAPLGAVVLNLADGNLESTVQGETRPAPGHVGAAIWCAAETNLATPAGMIMPFSTVITGCPPLWHRVPSPCCCAAQEPLVPGPIVPLTPHPLPDSYVPLTSHPPRTATNGPETGSSGVPATPLPETKTPQPQTEFGLPVASPSGGLHQTIENPPKAVPAPAIGAGFLGVTLLGALLFWFKWR